MERANGDESGQDKILGLPVHPLANAYPLMRGAQFDAFCESVRLSMKVHEKVTIHDGQILDGRNRLRAVERIQKETGTAPEWTKEEWKDDGSELMANFVERKNGHRRGMSEDQKAVSAVIVNGHREKEESERRKKASQFGSASEGATDAQPADSETAATPLSESPSNPTEKGRRKRGLTAAERLAAHAGVKKHRVESALKLQKEKGEDVLRQVLDGSLSLAAALGKKKEPRKEGTVPEQVHRLWGAMKKNFATADLPEVRKELQKLLKAEMEKDRVATPKLKIARKTTKTLRPFDGMGFVIGGAT